MLILASSSPRRKELLARLTPTFAIDPPFVDESLLKQVSPEQLPLQEAKMKAYACLQKHFGDEILACDTAVIFSNRVLGKPKDEEEAFKMLCAEQGKRQVVVSGYCYIGKGKEITRSVATAVYFNPLSETQIRDYIKRFRPLDKAGAYGIQDDYPLIGRIEGSYFNVMGLPLEDIAFHVFGKRL